MQEAAQQKKPKGKRASVSNSPQPWGLLGRGLEHETLNQSRAAKPLPTQNPHGTSAYPQQQNQETDRGAQHGDAAIPFGAEAGAEGTLEDRGQDGDGAVMLGDATAAIVGDGVVPAADAEGFGLLPSGNGMYSSSSGVECLCANLGLHIGHQQSPKQSNDRLQFAIAWR